MPKVGIVDYGMGNLRSVEKGLQKVGVDAHLCSEVALLSTFDGLVLPGVGAFGDAMRNLKDLGMDEALLDYIETGRQLLGICLGLQLLFDYSEEHGRSDGLGVIPGCVIKLPASVKVPHMGWNVLNVKREVPLFEGLDSGSRFYFVHSFYCEPAETGSTIGTTSHGLEFTCAASKGNVWGLQFHPEKSSLLGLSILRNFGKMVAESI
jgi:imidazole glycerol-phosphate synthase subunit HisH